MNRPALLPSSRWLPLMGGLAGAAGGAVVVGGLPSASIADAAWRVGVDAVPDRTTLMTMAAVIVGSVCWAGCYLLWGRGGVLSGARRQRRSALPPRQLMHQPAPSPRSRPQWPIAAVDIPAPTPRARPLPADLDQPLSAFDPNSIPLVSFESIRRHGLRPER